MGGFLGMAELAHRAVWVRRLGCVHRGARADGVTAIPEPMGLSVDRAAAARAEESPSGRHHGWVTGLRISGAGGPACLVSLSPEAPQRLHSLREVFNALR
jgi:hypothetical protein